MTLPCNGSTQDVLKTITEKSLSRDAANAGKIKVKNDKAGEAKRTKIKNRMDSLLAKQWLAGQIKEVWEL